jgi:hypothetical protein
VHRQDPTVERYPSAFADAFFDTMREAAQANAAHAAHCRDSATCAVATARRRNTHRCAACDGIRCNGAAAQQQARRCAVKAVAAAL